MQSRRSAKSAGELGPAAGDVDLLAAALEIHSHLELPGQLAALLGRIVEWCDARAGIALAPAEDGRVWTPIASTLGEGDPRLESFRRTDPGRLGAALEAGRIFEDLGPLAPLVVPWPEAVPQQWVGIPLAVPEKDWKAALLLLGSAPAESALERSERLIELVRPALANALQVLSMRELVIKDDTAHCYNRRHFETSLPDELARANRFHSPLSLIFLDMDNLKEVNTRHGHAMGSRTLCEVSRRIRAKIRRFDKLFRFGGDEFCIVLPETEWHGALEVAERVRDAIASKPFLVRELKNGEGIRMTASLGIASFPLHARTRDELIEHADRAMQRIKNATKNSIGIAEIVGEEHGR